LVLGFQFLREKNFIKSKQPRKTLYSHQKLYRVVKAFRENAQEYRILTWRRLVHVTKWQSCYRPNNSCPRSWLNQTIVKVLQTSARLITFKSL